MKVIDILNHLKKIGTWVNWKATADKILYGDAGIEITGIAVAWMPSFPNLKRAKNLGCNLFVTHEPLYAGIPNAYGVYTASGVMLEEDDPWNTKGDWLKESGMTVLRVHDTWDDYPGTGIHGAWAKWLGFTGKPVKQIKFYEVHEFEQCTFQSLCQKVLQRVKTLGQDVVLAMGDLERLVSSIALGTGAITDYKLMFRLGADVLLLTDDGTRLWESGQWAEDTGVPVIVVNHATAEEPGIRELAAYLREGPCKGIPVHAIERGSLYKAIS